MNEIRCPYCNKKILEHAEGVVAFRCNNSRCKRRTGDRITVIDTKELVAVN